MLYVLTIVYTDGFKETIDSYDYESIKEIIIDIADTMDYNDVVSFNFEIQEDE